MAGTVRAREAAAAAEAVSRISSRHSFVAITTRDLRRARAFWVGALGFKVIQQKRGEFFMVDAGGVRLCVDRPDGEVHRAGGGDPVIGLRGRHLGRALAALAKRRIRPTKGPLDGRAGAYAEIREPDGRTVVLTEFD